jgi:hypothetical protein
MNLSLFDPLKPVEAAKLSLHWWHIAPGCGKIAAAQPQQKRRVGWAQSCRKHI